MIAANISVRPPNKHRIHIFVFSAHWLCIKQSVANVDMYAIFSLLIFAEIDLSDICVPLVKK